MEMEMSDRGERMRTMAGVTPAWAAELLQAIGDLSSTESTPEIARRHAGLAERWHALDTHAWERARLASLRAILHEARAHCPESEQRVLAAVDGVLAWLARGAPKDEQRRVRAAAATATPERSAAAVEAQSAAAWAASPEPAERSTAELAAAEAAVEAAADAARAAVWSASPEVADAAADTARAAAEAAAEWAADAARAAAWDRIARATLDAIAVECVRAEVGRG